ncbi:MAG: hypothetical protein ACI9UK_001095 [Candidatus Krumholzibacteriia bacterium]|jgi:hypothetical protein
MVWIQFSIKAHSKASAWHPPVVVEKNPQENKKSKTQRHIPGPFDGAR